jgi:hypothetical protein
MLLHLVFVLRCWYDSEFVMVYPKTARMHALVWILGIGFYTLVPLSLMSDEVRGREHHP